MRNKRSDSLDSLREELMHENPKTLLDRLEAAMGKEEIDADEVSLILDVLDEVAPMHMPVQSPEEDLRDFWEKCGPILEAEDAAKKARSPRRHVLRYAMAACMCVVMLLAVVQASGVDLIGQFLEWGEETFVLRGRSGQMILDSAPEGEFASAEEAVATYGITEKVVPQWIPVRYGVQSVRVKELKNAVNITARYGDGNDQATVVKIYMSREESNQVDGAFDAYSEHSAPDKKPDTITINDIDFLLTDNNAQYRAVWETGACTCSINGDLTRAEIVRMLKSIFLEEG